MRIKEIQALRALASVLVVIYHAKLIKGGYIGVDIFYVISGYLITGLLLGELEKSGGLSFKSFYLRRIKRLLPSSFLVLIVTGIVAWIFYPDTMRHELGKDISAGSIYISNYLFAHWQMDYQNLGAVPPVIIHYWSLAVEEQFYLVWPLFIFLAYKGGGRRLVGRSIAAITALSFVISLVQSRTSPIWAFYSLPTRAWELGVGALLIFAPQFVRGKRAIASISMISILVAANHFNDRTLFPGVAALIPVLGTAIAIASIGHWPVLVRKFSHLPATQFLGEISYPLYLWHWPVLVIPAVYLGRGLRPFEIAICVVVTLLLSWLTHIWIEEPLRQKVVRPQMVVKMASVVTGTSLLLGLGIYASYANQIQLPDGKRTALTNILEKPLVYNDGCHLNRGEKISPDCTYGKRGAKIKIVLFGDSHAAQWFPALERLAEQYQFELISLTKSSCPGPAVKKATTKTYDDGDCAAWRENSYKRIAVIHPEAVVVSGMQLPDPAMGTASISQWWISGEQRTLSQLKGNARHLIYLVDTPHPTRDILSCVASGAKNICDQTKPSAAYTISGFTNVDPNPWLCTKICPAVINNQVVYRDASHISVAMSEELSDKLGAALKSAGVSLQ